MPIGRGWTVVTADGKRVGDVTEVHPHYLLVSRGVLLVRDMYLPLGTVERTEGTKVILSVTNDVLRGMNLSHEPAPIAEPEPEPLYEPATSEDQIPAYDAESFTTSDTPAYTPPWQDEEPTDYNEQPSYTRPQPNGLVEVEPSLNLALTDFGYGEPIVLLQGWPFDSSVWEPLPSMLAEYNRVISFDPRGMGKSDAPWDYYSVDLLASDLHRVIIEQALYDVTLVAWSTAAPVALLYAHTHRKRVTRLVLLAPVLPTWLAEESAHEWLGAPAELNAATQESWAAELLDDRPLLFEKLVDRLTYRGLSEPRRDWLWQRLMGGAPHAQIKTWDALRIYDPAEHFPHIEAPVTILSGERDHLSPPALGTRLAGMLPRAQSSTLSDCGHALFIEQREAVAKTLRDLLAPAEPQPEPDHAEPEAEEPAGGEPQAETEEIGQYDAASSPAGIERIARQLADQTPHS